jgi:hypothetical protein
MVVLRIASRRRYRRPKGRPHEQHAGDARGEAGDGHGAARGATTAAAVARALSFMQQARTAGAERLAELRRSARTRLPLDERAAAQTYGEWVSTPRCARRTRGR